MPIQQIAFKNGKVYGMSKDIGILILQKSGEWNLIHPDKYIECFEAFGLGGSYTFFKKGISKFTFIKNIEAKPGLFGIPGN